MNYITKINSFWYSATMNPLSTGQVALWFALMHICNKENWTEWFQAQNQVLSILTGMSRSGILKARNELKQRGYIDFRERGTKSTLYKINKLNSTQDSMQDSKQDGVQDGKQKGVRNSNTLYKHKQETKTEIIVEHPNELCVQVIDYLNEKIGTKFKSSTQSTQRHISGRINEGYSLTDFITVIDKKTKEWNRVPDAGQKDMRQYLRPETLFGTKFESYLNQKEVREISGNQFLNFEQRETDFDSLEKELLSY